MGSRSIPLAVTYDALTQYDPANDLHLIVWSLRVPRTILAVLVGAALGLAGTLTQALTRNPLAEPGLLGVNAGAATAIAVGLTMGMMRIEQYVWLGCLGAAMAGLLVYLLGGSDDQRGQLRLILAGVGLSFILNALTTAILLNSPDTVYNSYRNWITGSLQGRGYEAIPVIGVACLVGGGLAMLISRQLNILSMGRDLARALGTASRLVWLTAGFAIMILAGAATAVAGPIMFVGLVAPHMARAIVGPDFRWALPFAMLLAANLLLIADWLGRIIVPPGELGAGVMAALVGGPIFAILARRRNLARQ